jgi:hypothetical protein
MTRTQRTATIVVMATGVAMMLSACGKAAPTGTVQPPAPAKETATVLERAADSCNVVKPDFVEDDQGGQVLFLLASEGARLNPDLSCILSALNAPSSAIREMGLAGDGENGSNSWDGITAHWSYDAQLGLDVSLLVVR